MENNFQIGENTWLVLIGLSAGILIFQIWSAFFFALINRRADYAWYTVHLLTACLLAPFTWEPFLSNFPYDVDISILFISLLSYSSYFKFYGILFAIDRSTPFLYYLWRGLMGFYVLFAFLCLFYLSTGFKYGFDKYYVPFGIIILSISFLIYLATIPKKNHYLLALIVFGSFGSDLISLVAANYMANQNELSGIRLHFVTYAIECFFFALALAYQTKTLVRNNQNLEYTLIKEKLDGLNSKLTTHFVANSLNAMYRFLLNREGDAATFYFLKFSRLLRGVLQHGQQDLVTVTQEVGLLQLYLEMEALRFAHQFTFEVEVGDSSLADNTLLPPFLLQPLLENAIYHGLLPKRADGHLRLGFAWQKEDLRITIEDNGVGRGKAALEKGPSLPNSQPSLGLTIVRDRLKSFASATKRTTTLTIDDLFDADGQAAGTRVVLVLGR
ncbi:histidine kinase [Neolewinella lacunae]|uniref:Histidine kinase n=1 Tax=Neolewinella lacunae TaxID=1517758 RepID=A0A923PNT9_9BACT|nr:histidine kinase [Neolewinella lacunae]MBC6994729.1 histidine kinase [Neolewinella lacunae]MDN3634601.1 histidine kinase [Neolewinella lacunae]